jgi:hypothetical protein
VGDDYCREMTANVSQEYELVGKSKEVLQAMKELGAGTTVQNIVAQMVTTKGPEL